jgi:cell division protein FtsB
MTGEASLMATLDQQIEALQQKDRDLKRERDRIEKEIKDNRPELHALVVLKKAYATKQ